MALALVTGAGSGMGEAAAALMHAAGWSLLSCDLHAERLADTAARIGGETLAADIAAPGFSAQLVTALAGRPLGAVIHCAGLSPTMADPARILEVNLAATMRLSRAVLPHMAQGGCVVLFSSSSAYMLGDALDAQIAPVTEPEDVAALLACSPDSGAAYAVSKRGVQLLVKRAASDFGQRGARIVSVSPGIIDTPMGRAEMAEQPIMQKLVDATPLGRSASAEEVAAVAVFLCSPAASFVSGIDILVDGGSMAVALAAQSGGATSG